MQVASSVALSRQLLLAQPQHAGSCRGGAPPPPRPRCRRALAPPPRAAADFAELRATAADAVSAAQSKLPALEKAKAAAEQHREPAAEAERRWQELHGQLTTLQKDAAKAQKQLREGVVAAAGGESVATHALVHCHLGHRLEQFRANHGLAGAQEWKEFRARDLQLNCIPGGKAAYQLAAVEQDGERYAVVALAIANPFLFENLRALVMHWGCTEGANAGWGQPPKGWHSSPSVSTPAGDRAWETVFGAFAPVIQGETAPDATVYSVVLQVPLEGFLELRGGVKCVLRRTDHGQPEWIKAGPHNSGDFFLDFSPAIKLFERRRRAVQAAAIAQAREAAVAAARAAAAAVLEKAAAERAKAVGEVSAEVKDWANLLESDEWGDTDIEALVKEAVPAVNTPSELEEEKEEAAGPEPPRWVHQVEYFEALSDLPQERTTAQNVRCLHRIAVAVAEARHDGSHEARELLNRCLEVERLLSQADLLELNTRAAQQEKENLQALYKSAKDESAHLMQELTHAADAARRTAVKLRGRDTEVTVRDLEAVAQQAAQELLKKSGGGGFWPFKEEERQLVFVQQKVMEVAGMDAAVVVQVFVEGTKAAVEAAIAPPKPAHEDEDSEDSEGEGASGNGATPNVDGAPASVVEAVLADAEKKKSRKGKKKKEKEKEKERPGFEHVVLGISVAEEFPDDRLKTPLIMHMGCVAHQYAKWRAPPSKWSCAPVAVSDEGASASQVPFQRYRIAAAGGASVFVDPTLFALALRFPLKDCLHESVRGIEFVLKTDDGQWLSWSHGHGALSNFYAELPLPMP